MRKTFVLLVCICMYPYVSHMLVVCIRMYPYVPYVIRMLPVCYPYVLAWCLSHDVANAVLESTKMSTKMLSTSLKV